MTQLLQYVQYPFVTLVLIGGILSYMKFAVRKRILDIPQKRSSHSKVTILGGGVVLVMSALLYVVLHPDLERQAPTIVGLILISLVSFQDDRKPIPAHWRLLAQVVALTLLFYRLEIFYNLSPLLIAGAYILFTGILNAYNFMDGINGMTGLHSLVVGIALQWVNLTQVRFTHPDQLWFGMLACLVFLWFNCRKKALCFAGDVGSISMAYLLIFVLLELMLTTQNFVWILFLSVYGVETIGTLLHRIFQKKSVFKPHRTFFFQILSNECRWPQRRVSGLYSLIQFIVCLIVICYWKTHPWWELALIIIPPLVALYLLKFRMMKHIGRQRTLHQA